MMRHTYYTDYGLRVLIYLATRENHSLTNIQDIADSYNISKNHLKKVVFRLGKLNLIETVRGRSGGIRLAMSPKDINIGKVIQNMEEDFKIVECFDTHKGNSCVISPACQLKGIFSEALNAYLNVLNQYTLDDVIKNKEELYSILSASLKTTTS